MKEGASIPLQTELGSPAPDRARAGRIQAGPLAIWAIATALLTFFVLPAGPAVPIALAYWMRRSARRNGKATDAAGSAFAGAVIGLLIGGVAWTIRAGVFG